MRGDKTWGRGQGIRLGIGIGKRNKEKKNKRGYGGQSPAGTRLASEGGGLAWRLLVPGTVLRAAGGGWGLAGWPAGWALAQGAAIFFLNDFRAQKTQKRKSKRAPKLIK